MRMSGQYRRVAGCLLGVFAILVAACVPDPSTRPIPVLSLPDDLTVAAVAPTGAAATFSVVGFDSYEGALPVSCSHESGDEFVVGVTTVQCSTINSLDWEVFGSFTVNVTPYWPALSDVTKSSLSESYSCWMRGGGEVRCSGTNYFGRLGNGTIEHSDSPIPVTGISNATDIATGNTHACAVLSDGQVKCWGRGNYGALGNAQTGSSSVPVTAGDLTSATAVDAGVAHSCAVLNDATVRCWGQNTRGQLGVGHEIDWWVPIEVVGLGGATDVDVGYYHSCAVLASGGVRCWGQGGDGQLGNGADSDSSEPVEVQGISNAVQVVAGGRRSCARLADGSVQCWGSYTAEHLGNGETPDSSVPVTVPGIANAVDISLYSSHACAVLADGSVKCWGDNSGPANTGGGVGPLGGRDTAVPVDVPDVVGAVSIGVGWHSSCAVLSDSTATCWGANAFGQLGTATTYNGEFPLRVVDVP